MVLMNLHQAPLVAVAVGVSCLVREVLAVLTQLALVTLLKLWVRVVALVVAELQGLSAGLPQLEQVVQREVLAEMVQQVHQVLQEQPRVVAVDGGLLAEPRLLGITLLLTLLAQLAAVKQLI